MSKTCYDKTYKENNAFSYKEWLYMPYVKTLIRLAGLKKNSSILDVPCGQGFFSYLFMKNGMQVYGADINYYGVKSAMQNYSPRNNRFSVADAMMLPYSKKFDCIFTRSCSLYNSESFQYNTTVTDMLISYLKKNGALIFACNTNLSYKKDPCWVNHRINDVKRHFLHYNDCNIYLINKFDVVFLKQYAFSPITTKINDILINLTGCNGDVVCILKKH